MASVTFNNYGWLPWDYAAETLIYFVNEKEYICMYLSCKSSSVSYIPTTYVVVNSNDYFYNDDRRKQTCFSKSFSTKCMKHTTTQYIKQFESISVINTYLYIKCPDIITIGFYVWDSNGNVRDSTEIYNDDARWQLKEFFYSFQVLEDQISLVKYSNYLLNGNKLLWSASLPLCRTKDPNNELFVSVAHPFVFIICSSSNLIYKVYHDNGKILTEYPLDSGNVKAFECSYEFLFILYGDANIVQYTLEFNYVHTYSIRNTKTPKYNTLKVDDNYLLCVLCTGSLSSNECLSPVLYQWSVVKKIPKVIINYASPVSNGPSDLKSTVSSTIGYKAVPFRYHMHEDIFSPNYNFYPVTYKDDDNLQHIIYFSGGGNAAKGTCGDIFLHDIILKQELHSDIPITSETFLYQRYLVSGAPKYPISDYAAALHITNDYIFYIIHGGISCDYKTIYSDLFCIDVKGRNYITIEQNEKHP